MRFKILACLLLVSTFGFSQQDSVRSLLKLDAAALLDSKFALTFEQRFNRNLSAQITAGTYLNYFNYKGTVNGVDTLARDTRTGFYVIPEFRHYLSNFTGGRPPTDGYISIFALVGNSDTRKIDFENHWRRENQEYGLGISCGMQWLIFKNLGLDLDFGVYTFYEFGTFTGQKYNGVEGFFRNESIQRLYSSRFSARLVYGF